MPHWIAIESTLAGYDVLSRISSSDASTLMIEVKGSTRSPGTASITLSRNEWNTLVDSSRAVLDAWLIDGGHYATLHRVTMEPLSTLIPVDQRCGKWQTVVIPYASLPPACAQATWTESADHSCDYRDISE
jgi:hypothetical protein